MLKRVLIIAALFMLGAVLLGTTPETEPTPEPEPADEAGFEITEGEADAVHGNTADGTAIAIVWGEGVEDGDLPEATVVPADDEARARYQNIPAEILDQLPAHIRSAMDAYFGVSSGALNSQQQDWWCALTVPLPYEDEDNDLVRNVQNLDCGGADLHKIRLRSLVERQSGSIWFTLVSYNSGWIQTTGLENNLGAGCPAGTFDYRAKGIGSVMLTDWSVVTFHNTSDTTEITC